MSPGPCSRSSPRLRAPLLLRRQASAAWNMKEAPGAPQTERLRPRRLKTGLSVSARPERTGEVNPLEQALVPELVVHAPHGPVGEVVLGTEVAHACVPRRDDLGVLQRLRDATTARSPRDTRHRVLARVLGELGDDAEGEDDVVLEGDERQLRCRPRPEVPRPPRLEVTGDE